MISKVICDLMCDVNFTCTGNLAKADTASYCASLPRKVSLIAAYASYIRLCMMFLEVLL